VALSLQSEDETEEEVEEEVDLVITDVDAPIITTAVFTLLDSTGLFTQAPPNF
jgi:hypothetical protein